MEGRARAYLAPAFFSDCSCIVHVVYVFYYLC